MQRAGLLLGGWTRAWKSVRMASSGVNRHKPLENKVALVTASTDGIGFAIARRLAEDGAHVVISSRKQKNVDRAVATLQGEGLSVTGIVCHVGKAEDRERLVATMSLKWGSYLVDPGGGGTHQEREAAVQKITQAVKLHQGIDILVSNAAVNPFFGSLMDVTEDVWDKILSINVTAAAMLIKAAVPEIEKRGGGSVVIVGSIAGFRQFSSLGPYNVSKTALLSLTKNFAEELAPKNIRVNCLAPGIIKTRFSSMLWMDKSREEMIKESMKIRRLGKPEDCAGIVSFLCSEDASYINGETVVVAGGAPSRL